MPQAVLTTSSEIQVRRISGPAEWKALEVAWRELLSDSPADALFLCWEWLDTWLDVYGDGGDWVILTAHDHAGRLLGVAPMMIDRGAGKFGRHLRRLLLIGQKADTASEYLDWILRRGFEPQVTRAFCHHIHSQLAADWDILQFDSMRADSVTIPLLTSEFARQRSPLAVTVTTTAPYLTLPPDWEAFLDQQRAKFRQRWNKFHRDHAITVRIAGHDFSVADGMRKIRELNESRWGEKRQSFLSERYIRFHDRVAARLHERGHLLLIFLEADGAIIAGRYDFAYGGKGWSFQGGWVPEWEKHSAGKMMLTHVMKQCMAQGLSEYDFLGGAASYKTEWSDAARDMVSVHGANGKSPRGRLYLFLKALKARTRAGR